MLQAGYTLHLQTKCAMANYVFIDRRLLIGVIPHSLVFAFQCIDYNNKSMALITLSQL